MPRNGKYLAQITLVLVGLLAIACAQRAPCVTHRSVAPVTSCVKCRSFGLFW